MAGAARRPEQALDGLGREWVFCRGPRERW